MKRTKRSAVFMAMALTSFASSSVAAADCAASQAALETFLRGVPTACATDFDCAAYYLRADPCAPPIPITRAGMRDVASDRRYMLLKVEAQRACFPGGVSAKSCPGRGTAGRCEAGRCIAGERPSAPAATYRFATMTPSCAPWDGPATAVTFTTVDAGCAAASEPFASFHINRGAPAGGAIFRIERASDAAGGNRCPTKGRCEAATGGSLTIDAFEAERSATVRFRLEFRGGTTEEGVLKARWCPARPLCG